MPYDDRRKLMQPDFYPDQQMGWQDFGEDQPIDMGPAAGAFKQRFMQKPNMGTGQTPMTNSLPMMDSGMDAGGGAPLKKAGLKSL